MSLRTARAIYIGRPCFPIPASLKKNLLRKIITSLGNVDFPRLIEFNISIPFFIEGPFIQYSHQTQTLAWAHIQEATYEHPNLSSCPHPCYSDGSSVLQSRKKREAQRLQRGGMILRGKCWFSLIWSCKGAEWLCCALYTCTIGTCQSKQFKVAWTLFSPPEISSRSPIILNFVANPRLAGLHDTLSLFYLNTWDENMNLIIAHISVH